MDVDRVSRELDVAALQENVFNVAFCNIEAEVGTLPPSVPSHAHIQYTVHAFICYIHCMLHTLAGLYI